MKSKFYQNYETALKKLLEFVNQGILDDLDRAGLIQGFEFTFEQCWKAIQKKAVDESMAVNSPKQAFTWAIDLGWISKSDEHIWLKILEDRNQTTHTYKAALAILVATNIINLYASAFSDLLQKMKSA
jgi:nucleotidyltransferase substrate binding protein (TIGR01987 family)